MVYTGSDRTTVRPYPFSVPPVPYRLMSVLLSGGTGYIGSHVAVAFIEAGHSVLLADDLRNSKPAVVDRIAEITGVRPAFVQIDLAKPEESRAALAPFDFDGVVHLAGNKAVAESVNEPLLYYDNNLRTTLTLINECVTRSVRRMVFSSSATIYGAAATLPFTEEDPAPTQPTNPYGWTKVIGERILTDVAGSGAIDVALLRYFNAVAAHSSGLIGEDPRGTTNNLMPLVSQVASSHRALLSVFGNDYPTRDGTCIRDYIHVQDLAAGHVAAWRRLAEPLGPIRAYNLGTGVGTTVLEVVDAFERASGAVVRRRFTERRPGDVPVAYADPSRAYDELGWRAARDMETMCADTWRRQSLSPLGDVDPRCD